MAKANPNGLPNSLVVKPWINASDITQGSRDMWIIDFGPDMSLEEAAQFEEPFEYLRRVVKPVRDTVRRPAHKRKWWLFGDTRPGMRIAITGLTRFIVTPMVSKHRIFTWIKQNVIPENLLVVIAKDSDYFLGVLHSRIHEVWSRQQGSQLREAESGARYTPTTTFETFPFPWPPGQEPLADARVQAIAQAARELVEKRDRWLAEAVPAKDIDPAFLAGLNAPSKKPKKSEARTLTNLYNLRPTWLDLAHQKLDWAVFAAYGWAHDLSDEDILSRLLVLNLERSKK